MSIWTIFANFVKEGLWVEAASDGRIVWCGEDGWNFYYRISGSKTVQWHVMFYNPGLKLLYYRDEAFNDYFTDVTLRIRFRVSSNVYEITASKGEAAASEDHDAAAGNTSTKPGSYAYFLEPPVVRPVLNRYPVERICRVPASFTVAVSRTNEFVTDIGPDFNKCGHEKLLSTKFYVNCVTVHSHEERFSFTVERRRAAECSICYRLEDLDDDFRGYRVGFNRKETEFLFNY